MCYRKASTKAEITPSLFSNLVPSLTTLWLSKRPHLQKQLSKIRPVIGNIAKDISFFMAIHYMYFPFLICEVKCGAAALDIVDRQNGHSMILAVRAVVELFRLGKREKEIHREILAFSISHDHRTVRIYGHYPIIDRKETTYYRHPIREFSFTELEGKEKWTAYKFTKNVYRTWMPKHLARIRSIIDGLPFDIDFKISSFSASGLSQKLEVGHLSQQFTEPELLLDEPGNQLSPASIDVTPTTFFTGPETFKKSHSIPKR